MQCCTTPNQSLSSVCNGMSESIGHFTLFKLKQVHVLATNSGCTVHTCKKKRNQENLAKNLQRRQSFVIDYQLGLMLPSFLKSAALSSHSKTPTFALSISLPAASQTAATPNCNTHLNNTCTNQTQRLQFGQQPRHMSDADHPRCRDTHIFLCL